MPARGVIIYDGSCRFCVAGSARLLALGKPGTIERVASTEPGMHDRFPQVTREMIQKALQLVKPDGSVVSGAGAVAEVLSTRPAWRLVTWIYFVPGVRWLIDRLYDLVARNRYRIMGKDGGGTCENGACRLD